MQQKITLTLLGVCGMFLVRLLSVWIPLGPALERTYGVSPVAFVVGRDGIEPPTLRFSAE